MLQCRKSAQPSSDFVHRSLLGVDIPGKRTDRNFHILRAHSKSFFSIRDLRILITSDNIKQVRYTIGGHDDDKGIKDHV